MISLTLTTQQIEICLRAKPITDRPWDWTRASWLTDDWLAGTVKNDVKLWWLWCWWWWPDALRVCCLIPLNTCSSFWPVNSLFTQMNMVKFRQVNSHKSITIITIVQSCSVIWSYKFSCVICLGATHPGINTGWDHCPRVSRAQLVNLTLTRKQQISSMGPDYTFHFHPR